MRIGLVIYRDIQNAVACAINRDNLILRGRRGIGEVSKGVAGCGLSVWKQA